MSHPSILLTPGLVMFAANVGVARNVSALRDRRELETGRRDQAWERHILGAIGEYALSLHLDCAWQPMIGRLDTVRGDVGGYQVRATDRLTGSLIVKPDEDPDDWYALAIVDGCRVAFPGFLLGRDAKQDRYWRDVGGGVHQAAYFVPATALEGPIAKRALG